jgi:hypothetical protein
MHGSVFPRELRILTPFGMTKAIQEPRLFRVQPSQIMPLLLPSRVHVWGERSVGFRPSNRHPCIHDNPEI